MEAKVEESVGGVTLSIGDDDAQVWDDREVRVMVERAREAGRIEGWEAALDAVGARRVERGGGGYEGAGDLRRLVGERFASAIEAIWEASLRQLRSTVPGGNGGLSVRVGRRGIRPRTGTLDQSLRMRGAAGSVGGTGGRGLGAEDGGVIRDEIALAFKARVERKIRQLTREMESWLASRSSVREENVVRRCEKCRRFVEAGWKFCPLDGSEVRSGS